MPFINLENEFYCSTFLGNATGAPNSTLLTIFIGSAETSGTSPLATLAF